MKYYLKITIIILILICTPVYSSQIQNSDKSEYLKNIHKWRALLYNGLNLCPEQVEKFEEIYNNEPDKDLRKKIMN